MFRDEILHAETSVFPSRLFVDLYMFERFVEDFLHKHLMCYVGVNLAVVGQVVISLFGGGRVVGAAHLHPRLVIAQVCFCQAPHGVCGRFSRRSHGRPPAGGASHSCGFFP